MLGTPNQGSHAITALLMGRDPLVRKLALLDFRHKQETLLGIISRFNGVLQLLPHQGDLNIYGLDTWKELQRVDRNGARGVFGAKIATEKSAEIDWPLPTAQGLKEAAEVRALLQQSPLDPQRMMYVAGSAEATPCNIRIDKTAPLGRQIKVDATSFGDGRVPWDTGIPRELKAQAYYLDCEHGDLANAPASFEGLLDLLQAGKTTKLRQTAPTRRGQKESNFEWPDRLPTRYPSEADVIASALGSSGERPSVEATAKIQVQMVHGNLTRATAPLLVGHYEGDTIVSAEAALDNQLEGRLRKRHDLNIYPNKLKTTAIFLGDHKTETGKKHPGAIVLGLGMVGELTPGALAMTVAHGVTRYMLRCIEEEREKRRATSSPDEQQAMLNLSVTTLLIGTGGAGMTVVDSMQSILRGILAANERYDVLKKKHQDGGHAKKGEEMGLVGARIESVGIIELWEDLAIQGMKGLLQLGRSAEFRDKLIIEELLVEGQGGQSRVSYDESPGWWQRMRIMTEENGALKFDVLTNRSRAETYLQPTQRTLVESFLKRAVSTTANDPALSSTLFELIIPNRLKEYATDRRNLALVLDDHSAAYPWELLHDRLDQESRPLSVTAGMIRQLTTSEFRENVLPSTEVNALVVGDPTFNEATGKFSPLPGAAEEARAVAKLLRERGYPNTVELVEQHATPQAILTELYSRPYKVIHLAAHGVFEYPLEGVTTSQGNEQGQEGRFNQKVVTGMVLGDGMYLTPAEIEQMRYVPELVFINCCHLGNTKTKGKREQEDVAYHRLASNLATQLIRMGVRAVVAAGWAVNDEAAKTFAHAFYEALFHHRPFGDAVRVAREETYVRHPGSNTWGAYQCYGDPDFALTNKTSRSQSHADEGPVAKAELRKELENLTQWAKSDNGNNIPRIQEKLVNLTKGMGADWTNSSATCAALGRTYGEVGLFEEAVRFYDRGRTIQPADAPVESLEQLANLKVRWALARAEQKSAGKENRPDPTEKEFPTKDLFIDAENILDGLLQIQPTQERLNMKGSLYKGKAMFSTGVVQRRKALEDMKDWYGKGYQFGKAAKRDDLYYPLENRLAADIVLSWEPSKGRKTQKSERERKRVHKQIEEGLAELQQYGEERWERGQTFWDMSLIPGQRLLSALQKQSLTSKERKPIIDGYRQARQRGGSAREMDSVIKNIKFFEVMLQASHLEKVRGKLASGLKALRQGLEEKKASDS